MPSCSRHSKLRPATKGDIGGADIALDHRVDTRLQRADRRNAGAILVAQRQMEQQILYGANAELFQLFRQARADPANSGDGNLIEREGSAQGHRKFKPVAAGHNRIAWLTTSTAR